MSYLNPAASTTNFGVVEIGANIDVVSGVIDIPQSIDTTDTVTFDVVNATTAVNGGDIFDNANRVITSLIAGTNISITGVAPTLTINSSATPDVATTLITAADTPYAALATDYYIGVSSAVAMTINLPAGQDGDTYIIKDELGIGSGPITIVPNGAETIEGAANYVSAIPLASVTFIFRGTNWNAV